MITIPPENTEIQKYKILGYRLLGLLSQMVFLQHYRIIGMYYGPMATPERL